MPQISIKTNLPQVKKNLENLAADIPEIGRGRIYGYTQRVLKRLKKPGRKITYPVNWDSEKQRIAFFASNGFGSGIPYSRKGAYQKGWNTVKIENGYRIQNSTEGAKYIGGDAYGRRQSKIHKGRWLLLRDVVEQEAEKLPKEIRDSIITVARRKGF